ncbi:hypothetical protein PLESTM_001350900 [Pleodorina starrii]|nr:hypothetical protein PLESTM_001350900 [Pleodorina starrii]
MLSFRLKDIFEPGTFIVQGTMYGNGSSNVVRDWPEMDNRTVVSIYNGGAQNGWQDASYNGAIVFKSYNKGAFADHVAVGVYIYMSTSTQIDKGIVMAIGGDAGDCIVVDLTDVKATGFVPRCKGCTDYWWKFEVYLSAFAGFGPTSIINNAKYFKGCGGNDVNQLTYMEIRNYRNSAMNLCVDDVRLQ